MVERTISLFHLYFEVACVKIGSYVCNCSHLCETMGQSYTPQIIETPGGQVSLLEIEQRQAYPISNVLSVSITARRVLCNRRLHC